MAFSSSRFPASKASPGKIRSIMKASAKPKQIIYNLVHEFSISSITMAGEFMGGKGRPLPGKIVVNKGITQLMEHVDPDTWVAVKLYYCQQRLATNMTQEEEEEGEEEEDDEEEKEEGEEDDEEEKAEDEKKMAIKEENKNKIVHQPKRSKSVIFNHDYVVVEMKHGEKSVYVRADKVGLPQAGIIITLLDNFDSRSSTYNLNLRGAKFKLHDLVEDLKAHDPTYQVQKKNCWEYAKATAERIALHISQGMGNSEQKEALEKEAAHIKMHVTKASINRALLKIIPSIASFSS